MWEFLIEALLLVLYGLASFAAGMYYKEKVLAEEKKVVAEVKTKL